MNEYNSDQLIDEEELRAALRPMRRDHAEFERAVLRKIESSNVTLPSENHADRNASEWMRVAASIIPLSMFGSGKVVHAAGSLAKVSVGKKLIGFAAVPAIGVFLMIGGTVMAMFRIRSVSRDSVGRQVTAEDVQKASSWWWKRYGWMPVTVAFTGLLLRFGLGVTIPILPIFLLSGLAMVGFITYLGKHGWVSRRAIGGSFLQGLLALAQISGVFIFDADIHLLDPNLVRLVLTAGGLLMMPVVAFATPKKNGGYGGWLLLLIVSPLAIGLCGWLSKSLWEPSAETYLRIKVEAFDKAPAGHANWIHWEEPALVFIESGSEIDLSKPKTLMNEQVLEKPDVGYKSILRTAMVTGLLKPFDLANLEDIEKSKSRLIGSASNRMHEINADRQIMSLSQYDFDIRALHATNQLSPEDRTYLTTRLKTTVHYILSKDYHGVREVQHTIALLELIAGRESTDEFKELIHEFLIDLKRDGVWMTARRGGFASSRRGYSGDPRGTVAAIRLMERFGIPDGIDTLTLRSFLRISQSERRFLGIGGQRAAGQLRLTRLPGLPPLTWWDYVRYEQGLIMAVFLVALAFYATLAAPGREVTPPAE